MTIAGDAIRGILVLLGVAVLWSCLPMMPW